MKILTPILCLIFISYLTYTVYTFGVFGYYIEDRKGSFYVEFQNRLEKIYVWRNAHIVYTDMFEVKMDDDDSVSARHIKMAEDFLKKIKFK